MRHFSDEVDGLRLLMADELDAIAGGEGEDTDEVPTLPPIPVIADPIDDLVVPIYFGGGFGGVGTTAPEAPAPTTEPQIDAQACAAVQSIKSQPNYESQEYGYFIIDHHDGQGPHLSRLYTSGLEGKIDLGAMTPLDIGVSSWSEVIGFVHNHPKGEDFSFLPGDVNVQNRMPSDDDWNIADQISSRGVGNEFRQYIIGPDGVTRQYDVSDVRDEVSTDTSGGNCP